MQRLHWFWRGAIATLAGVVLGVGLCGAVFWIATGMKTSSRPAFVVVWVVAALSIFLVPSVAAIATYAALVRRYGPPASDGETRCRKCGYILRGIPEPRCSECGERI